MHRKQHQKTTLAHSFYSCSTVVSSGFLSDLETRVSFHHGTLRNYNMMFSSNPLLSVHTGLEENDLDEPLLELYDEDDEDDVAPMEFAPRCFGSSHTSDVDPMFTLWDHLCLLLILPTLLSIQFGLAYPRKATSHANAFDPDELRPATVRTVIALYVVTSYMYKASLHDSRLLSWSCWEKNYRNQSKWSPMWSSLLQQCLLLLPEIGMDVVLGLVLVVSTTYAFQVLLMATIFLASAVILATAHILCCEAQEELPLSDDCDDDLDLSEREGVIRYRFDTV